MRKRPRTQRTTTNTAVFSVAALVEISQQPAQAFEETSLNELAASLRTQDSLAALLVCQAEENKYGADRQSAARRLNSASSCQLIRVESMPKPRGSRSIEGKSLLSQALRDIIRRLIQEWRSLIRLAVKFNHGRCTPPSDSRDRHTLLLWLTILGAVCEITCEAQTVIAGSGDPATYHYFPGSKLALGLGFSPNNINDVKLPCIVVKPKKLDPGPPSTTYSYRYVRSSEEFTFAANIDSKASAQALGGSADSHFQVDTHSGFSQTSVNVLVSATTDFDRWGLEPPVELTPDAKALLKYPRRFEQVCGSRYVAIERRASSVSVLISVAAVTQSWKHSFEMENSGSYGEDGMSASARMKFSAELKRALASDRVEFQVFATGGSGLGGLKDTMPTLAGQPNPLDSISKGLTTFLGDFNSENPAAYSFDVASMQHLGWDPSGVEPWTDLKEANLRSIASLYLEVTDEINNIKDYQSGGRWRRAIRDPIESQVTKQLPDLLAYQHSLAEAHKSCMESTARNDCPFTHLDSPSLTLANKFRTPSPPNFAMDGLYDKRA